MRDDDKRPFLELQSRTTGDAAALTALLEVSCN